MTSETSLRIIQTVLGNVVFHISPFKQFKIYVYTRLFNSGRNLRVGYGSIFYREKGMKGKIKIGSNVSIGIRAVIDYSGGCNIGNNACISHHATIFTHEHPLKNGKYQYNITGIEKPLSIGEGAWIGYQAIILPSVEYIGRGSMVGAGSVVTKNVPDYSVVAGNPAKIIRKSVLTEKRRKSLQ